MANTEAAKIVFGSYMVRYPLGGMMSYVLQYLLGFQRLGHEVYFVEKAGYPNACFDLERGVMSDDCSYGTRVVGSLLASFGLGERWCYVDAGGRHHGMTRHELRQAIDGAIFVDMGTHGALSEEVRCARLRVLIDGEPGYNQIHMLQAQAKGEPWPEYDAYYTNGRNLGTRLSPAPTAGKYWRHTFHPVCADLFGDLPPSAAGPFTTVMNWQARPAIEYEGRAYGQKDVEFEKFLGLPALVDADLELAIAGRDVPEARLAAAGWRLVSAHETTRSYSSFRDYLATSKGEFAVCKNVFVSLRTGWFSDRSAAYLAAGRPVVMQDTGFGDHLPVGEGLFAVSNCEQAASAMDAISADYSRHSRAARDLAHEFLDSKRVLRTFLDQLVR